MREAEAGEPSMATAMPTTTSEEPPACTAVEMAAMAAMTDIAPAQAVSGVEEVGEAMHPHSVASDWGRVGMGDPVLMAAEGAAVVLVVKGTEAMVGLAAVGAGLSAPKIIVRTAVETEALAEGPAKETTVLTLVQRVALAGALFRHLTAHSEVQGRDWAAPSLATAAA